MQTKYRGLTVKHLVNGIVYDNDSETFISDSHNHSVPKLAFCLASVVQPLDSDAICSIAWPSLQRGNSAFCQGCQGKGAPKIARLNCTTPGVWHPRMSVHHVVLACSPSDNEWPHKRSPVSLVSLLSQDSLAWGARSPLHKACCILTSNNTEANHHP